MENRGRLEELRAEKLWRTVKADEEFFLENFWWIKTTDGPALFQLREAQRRGLAHWAENRYSLTLKARQIGWTTGVAARGFRTAYFQDAREVYFVSRGEREAIKDLMDKVKFGLKRLPAWMLDRGPNVVSETQTSLLFDNGSAIYSVPSKESPGRGSTGTLVVIDEWAFLPNPEEAWSSIEPIADEGGTIIGLSTANGSGNFFHQLWVDAEAGHNEFETLFEGWWANPNRDQDWYEAKKRSMNEWQLAQEYPSTPEEAFIKSGRPYFDLGVLGDLAVGAKAPEIGALV